MANAFFVGQGDVTHVVFFGVKFSALPNVSVSLLFHISVAQGVFPVVKQFINNSPQDIYFQRVTLPIQLRLCNTLLTFLASSLSLSLPYIIC